MAGHLLTHFDPDSTLLEPLLPATEYRPFDPETYSNPDWPGNMLSKRIVIYGDGTISRQGEPVQFAVEPGELAVCQSLSKEAETVVQGLPIAGGSGGYEFRRFYIAASEGAPVPTWIDPELIRTRFGGTIYPQAEVVVEPMAEAAGWWELFAQVYRGNPDLDRWKELVRWFRTRQEFVAAAFVRIGDNLERMCGVPDLADVEAFGVNMPRLALGLTHKGSLIGLAGCIVLA